MAKKRANGEGSIRQRRGGRWEGRLTYIDLNTGLRERVSVYGSSWREARDKMLEVQGRVLAGGPARDSTLTVAEWCRQWIAVSLRASSRRASTRDLYESLLRLHVMTSSLGKVRLDRLRPSHVEMWLIELRGETSITSSPPQEVPRKALSEASVIRCFQVLQVAIDGAVREGLLAANPVRKVKAPTLPRREVRYPSTSEVEATLAVLRGTRFYELFALLATTGMRKGEATGLRWADVDFEDRAVTVRGTLTRTSEGLRVTEVKTYASRRRLHPTEDVMNLLRAAQRRRDVERLLAGELWEEHDLVFATEQGRPLEPRTVLRVFQTAARDAGLQDATVHALRHTAATTMLEGGTHLKAVSQILGHAGTQITSDLYTHMSEETARRALDVLGRMLGVIESSETVPTAPVSRRSAGGAKSASAHERWTRGLSADTAANVDGRCWSDHMRGRC
ncbi:tyrosine-type recombinase/integrase [Oerskovia enterophila]